MEANDRKKMTRNEQKDEEIPDLDRLSCLPDSILSHILSFLDTISAIKTSMLSKRYRFLWTLSQILDFKLLRLNPYRFRRCYPHDFFDPKGLNVLSFEAHVNHVLQRREHSNLTMFRLSLNAPAGSEFIRNCIDYAARHKVRHLRIRGYTKQGSVVLPRLLLVSPSLTILHLNNAVCSSIELPKSLSLPNLKILRLKNFEFSDSNYNGEVFSGCLSLETLVLNKCWIRPADKLKTLGVNCSNLKNLEIKYWRSPWRCFVEQSIFVNVPALDFFKFQGHIAKVKFRDDSPCVNKAWIDICCPTACASFEVNGRMESSSESLIEMIRQLRNVKSLSLSLRTVEVMSVSPCLRPFMFENLRFIRFTAEEKYGEMTIPIVTVMQLTKSATSDTLVFDGFEEQKNILKCSKVKPKKVARPVAISTHVLSFLLETSPSTEFLSIEIPKVQSDEITG
ncbi:F-box/LRR-repeat protein At4g14103-like isoform X1 [Primulina huaijiensis]|uniref:F-box/LRR-repeat protein At4g14103-like isoform X1 n=1 Tax=Primulina huaijiensis TaxID=1492673 RepID=UPI003CC72A00